VRSVERRVLSRVGRTEAELVDGMRDVDLIAGEGGEVVRVPHGPVPGFAFLYIFYRAKKKRRRKKKKEGEMSCCFPSLFLSFSLSLEKRGEKTQKKIKTHPGAMWKDPATFATRRLPHTWHPSPLCCRTSSWCPSSWHCLMVKGSGSFHPRRR